MSTVQCVCFVILGTYGVAVTFVCGEKEKADLGRYAELCNMCISPLPGKLSLLFAACLPEFSPTHFDLVCISIKVNSGQYS